MTLGRRICPTHDLPSATSGSNALATGIAGRTLISPYGQGDFHQSCGLVAPINALRLALLGHAPLTKSDCRDLHDAGIAFLHRKGWLSDALIEGMGLRRRLSLARHLACQASITNCQVEIERPDKPAVVTIGDVFDWIETSLAAGRPVMVSLLGGLDHYTVVSAITSRTLQLFDSNGHRFLRRGACSVDGSTFHQIPTNGLLRIAVHRSG